jgi:hypothetical protein
VIIDNHEITEAEFTNGTLDKALVVDVVEHLGLRIAYIPNVLLQDCWDIRAYGCCDECVREAMIIEVEKRQKPDDYVYVETEIKRFEDLEKRIEALEKGGGSGGSGVDEARITAIETAIEANENSISLLETAMAEKENSITQLETAIEANENSISLLEKDIEDLFGDVAGVLDAINGEVI